MIALAVVASAMVVVTGRVEPALAVTPPTVTAQLVQMIPTSGFNPPSPDPSGIVYLPPSGPRSARFEIADSEVDETTGAGYHGVNLWQVTPNGTVLDKGTTLPYSTEPTGLGYGPDGGTVALFISDDSKRRIFVVKAGADGRYGTSDDVVTSVNVGVLGSNDAEDPEFDPLTGHLFFLDGVGTEIYNIDPTDGVFGNGNDTTTHFDISQYGNDFEGLSSDPGPGDPAPGRAQDGQDLRDHEERCVGADDRSSRSPRLEPRVGAGVRACEATGPAGTICGSSIGRSTTAATRTRTTGCCSRSGSRSTPSTIRRP